jgi:hypothetical protein
VVGEVVVCKAYSKMYMEDLRAVKDSELWSEKGALQTTKVLEKSYFEVADGGTIFDEG